MRKLCQLWFKRCKKYAYRNNDKYVKKDKYFEENTQLKNLNRKWIELQPNVDANPTANNTSFPSNDLSPNPSMTLKWPSAPKFLVTERSNPLTPFSTKISSIIRPGSCWGLIWMIWKSMMLKSTKNICSKSTKLRKNSAR